MPHHECRALRAAREQAHTARDEHLNFLKAELSKLPSVKVILSLGLISHNSVLKTCGEKASAFKFAHGAVHDLSNGLKLVDSYHCSRYNTQTKRLTTPMFEDVFRTIKTLTD